MPGNAACGLAADLALVGESVQRDNASAGDHIMGGRSHRPTHVRQSVLMARNSIQLSSAAVECLLDAALASLAHSEKQFGLLSTFIQRLRSRQGSVNQNATTQEGKTHWTSLMLSIETHGLTIILPNHCPRAFGL
jgi:hypothetical protein